jgi:putative Holliday junction resolvase
LTRVLAVDHGEKNIGLALSDPSGTIANPLMVIVHESREKDSERVAALAHEHKVSQIVVGQSFDEGGAPNLAGRRAARFAEDLRIRCGLPVELWDESFSTQDAREARVRMGGSRKKRTGHLDALAATVILQSYLDARVS